MGSQDKRALWNDSPQLRESVREDLVEWGRAQRGGWPDLGYPKEAPFSNEPQRQPPSYDLDKVDAMTKTLILWTLELHNIPDLDKRARFARMLKVLKVHFISDAPAEAKARRFKTSIRTFWRLVDEASFRFWLLHY